MTPEQEAVVRKVQKLLALAERAGSDHEATSAAAHARKLMQAYALNMTDVESLTSEDCVESAHAVREPYLPSHCKMLQCAVCAGYGVESFSRYRWENGRRSVSVVFVGIIPDVVVATQLFTFLDTYARRGARKHGYRGKRASAYKLAFAVSIHERLEQTAQEDAPEEHALVLVKGAAAKNYLQRFHGDMNAGGSINVQYDRGASAQGRTDGNAVSLNRPVEAAQQQALEVAP